MQSNLQACLFKNLKYSSGSDMGSLLKTYGIDIAVQGQGTCKRGCDKWFQGGKQQSKKKKG